MTLDELRLAFLAIDVHYFGGQLPRVRLETYSAPPGMVACCDFQHCRLRFDYAWLRCATRTEAVVTLKHEAAHLFARSFELRDHGADWMAAMMRFLPDPAIEKHLAEMVEA
jgi:hypothetical protein